MEREARRWAAYLQTLGLKEPQLELGVSVGNLPLEVDGQMPQLALQVLSPALCLLARRRYRQREAVSRRGTLAAAEDRQHWCLTRMPFSALMRMSFALSHSFCNASTSRACTSLGNGRERKRVSFSPELVWTGVDNRHGPCKAGAVSGLRRAHGRVAANGSELRLVARANLFELLRDPRVGCAALLLARMQQQRLELLNAPPGVLPVVMHLHPALFLTWEQSKGATAADGRVERLKKAGANERGENSIGHRLPQG